MHLRNSLDIKLRHGLLFLSTAVMVMAVDQLTKNLIRANMMLGESIPSEGRFRFSYSTNPGAVFGLSLDSTLLIILASTTAILMIWLYFHFLYNGSRLRRLGLGLVLGGALGNLIDRFALGEVTDFIDVRLWGDYHWPAFNVADAAVTVGVFLLIISLLISPSCESDKTAQTESRPDQPIV